jgi:hypothetical protein
MEEIRLDTIGKPSVRSAPRTSNCGHSDAAVYVTGTWSPNKSLHRTAAPRLRCGCAGLIGRRIPRRRSWSAAVGELWRSVQYTMQHSPGRTSGWPEGPRDASPGQASLQASVALGQSPRETTEPCRGETDERLFPARRPSPDLFRPVGALGDYFGRSTQGGAPRGLGACPGLSSFAPLGLGAPNQSLHRTAALRLRLGCAGVIGRRNRCRRPWSAAVGELCRSLEESPCGYG